MTFTEKIMDLGVLTPAGHIYPKQVIQQSIDDFIQSKMICFIIIGSPDTFGIDLTKVVAKAEKLWINQNALMAELYQFSGPSSVIYNNLRGLPGIKLVGYGLNGLGSYEKDGHTIKNFKLTSISFISIPAKSMAQRVSDMLLN